MPGTFYVEVSINGIVVDQTNETKLTRGKLVWNKDLTLYFRKIEPRSPITITLSLYKRRVIQFGFHLVGSFHFATSDLVGALNRGPWRTRVNLHLKKNQLTAKGIMVLNLNVKSLLNTDSASSVEDSRSTTSLESPVLRQPEDQGAAFEKTELPTVHKTSHVFILIALCLLLWKVTEITLTACDEWEFT
jgi:hypothetical protein